MKTIRVKKSVLTQLNGISENSYHSPRLPRIPKVGNGLESYGRTRKGKYIVPRFYVRKVKGAWFVRDFEEQAVALGTKKEGYQDRAEAIKIARSYCEKYGAWATSPF